MTDPVVAIQQLGASIARSQIFGCQNESQGQILALECMARRMPPLALAERYDIIQGKLSMKADAMLAGFEDAGGKYHVKEYTPEACEIVFERNGSTLPIRITWDQANQESWPFKSDGKTLKHNWATPIGRQDMLWARTVSRGVRRLAPGVVCGRYTPEEISDIPANGATAIESDLVDASFEVIEPALDPTPPLIREPEAAAATSMSNNDPVCATTEQQIRTAIEQAAQLGIPDIAGQVKAKLVAAGLAKIKDLTQTEAEMLLQAIELKSLGQWLENPIVRPGVEGDSGNSHGEQS